LFLIIIIIATMVTRRLVSSLTNNPVKWGILSAGRIASDYVKAITVTDGAVASAVAARCETKAKEFATLHGIDKSYGSYQDVIQSPDVDVVYIATTADYHFQWAKECLRHGTPCVVEKPITLSLDDTRELIDLARENNTFLMEGMWTRCFPALHKLRQVIESGELGRIVYCQADFGWRFPTDDLNDRIWNKQSGGVTLDIGMYCAQIGRVAFPKAQLKDVHATGLVKNGVDYSVMATVTYQHKEENEDGFLQFAISGAANTEERLVIQGTNGRAILDPPFHVPERLRVSKDQGRGEADEMIFDYPLPSDPFGVWHNPGSIGFVHQIDEVGKALKEGRNECDSFTWNDSLEVALIVEEIVDQVRGERAAITRART
jgi:dihydrodiol dehydrogenase / D-xylose 1-dehydrogenase (NADP)